MNFKNTINPIDIGKVVKNCPEPLILKQAIECQLLQWTPDKWTQVLNGQKLQFRCGKNSFTREPQWERTTDAKTLTFEQFLHERTYEKWMYFDYKYLKDFDVQEILDNISWNKFGFPDMSAKDSTIWIGSKGAHTPMHMDSYGCNIVVQIYGSKQWLLFPPEENLKPTRIPYEESSIYSKFNFFSPSEFPPLNNGRKILLQAGDVLIVPHKWWHYVENMETAISINLWVPLPIDCEEQLKEAIVQMLVQQLLIGMDREEEKKVLNPNMEDIGQLDVNQAFEMVKVCKDRCKKQGKNCLENVEDLLEKLDIFETIQPLNSRDFMEFLKQQSQRFPSFDLNSENQIFDRSNVINAVTHPDVVDLIKEKLFL